MHCIHEYPRVSTNDLIDRLASALPHDVIGGVQLVSSSSLRIPLPRELHCRLVNLVRHSEASHQSSTLSSHHHRVPIPSLGHNTRSLLFPFRTRREENNGPDLS